jgi:uncharacterized metal-binding protein YceD (DUF177 family)
MNMLDHFSVPYLGLKDGNHTIKFEVDDAFFEYFDQSIIRRGTFSVLLNLDKRPDMGVAELEFEGEAELECDRCLSPLIMYLEDNWRVHIKFGEDIIEDEELIVLPPETSSINFAQSIYEAIVLALPMIKVHEDDAECDPVMISKLHSGSSEEEKENNIWGGLKDLDLN